MKAFNLNPLPYWRMAIPQTLSLKLLTTLPLCLMVIVAMVSPSDGNYGLFTPKSLSYVFCMGSSAIFLMCSGRLQQKVTPLLATLLLGLAFAFITTLISLIREENSVPLIFNNLKIFIVTLTTFTVVSCVVRLRLISFCQLIKLILLGNFLYCTIKVVTIALGLFGIINPFSILLKIGVRVMHTNIAGNLSRLQTSLDVLTPYLWLFYLRRDNLNLTLPKPITWLYLPISAMSIFLSFSRYLWVVALFSALLGLLGRSARCWINVTVIMTSIVAILSSYIGLEQTVDIIERRFFSKEVVRSDKTRFIQIAAMTEEIERYPLLGKGMGSHASDRKSFSYEVQWISFVMQFGIPGFVIIFLAVLLSATPLLFWPLSWAQIAFLGGFASWIFGGFTNPFLLSLNSGLMYALYHLSGYALRNTSTHHQKETLQ